jgi:hypothetical protein
MRLGWGFVLVADRSHVGSCTGHCCAFTLSSLLVGVLAFLEQVLSMDHRHPHGLKGTRREQKSRSQDEAKGF